MVCGLQVKVDVDFVDFGIAVIDETLTRSIILTNNGARETKFTFDRIPCELFYASSFISSAICIREIAIFFASL